MFTFNHVISSAQTELETSMASLVDLQVNRPIKNKDQQKDP